MSQKHTLGDLQLAIMRVLWEAGEASASQVHQALHDRGLAPTTIATMLRKMDEKGVVAYRVDGRQYIYRPTVAQRDVTRTMVGEVVQRLFKGNAAALVSHLINEQEVDATELEALKRLIEARQEEADG